MKLLTEKTFLDKIKNILQQNELEINNISFDTSLYFDLGLSSLEVASLIMEIETSFGASLPMCTWQKIETFGDLYSEFKKKEGF